MLSYLVMPAVASLQAVEDQASLERIKYDIPRLHMSLLIPVTLLAGIYAEPFLELWVGRAFAGQIGQLVNLLRLFLVGTLPVLIAVPVQMALGLGKFKVIAVCAGCRTVPPADQLSARGAAWRHRYHREHRGNEFASPSRGTRPVHIPRPRDPPLAFLGSLAWGPTVWGCRSDRVNLDCSRHRVA